MNKGKETIFKTNKFDMFEFVYELWLYFIAAFVYAGKDIGVFYAVMMLILLSSYAFVRIFKGVRAYKYQPGLSIAVMLSVTGMILSNQIAFTVPRFMWIIIASNLGGLLTFILSNKHSHMRQLHVDARNLYFTKGYQAILYRLFSITDTELSYSDRYKIADELSKQAMFMYELVNMYLLNADVFCDADGKLNSKSLFDMLYQLAPSDDIKTDVIIASMLSKEIRAMKAAGDGMRAVKEYFDSMDLTHLLDFDDWVIEGDTEEIVVKMKHTEEDPIYDNEKFEKDTVYVDVVNDELYITLHFNGHAYQDHYNRIQIGDFLGGFEIAFDTGFVALANNHRLRFRFNPTTFNGKNEVSFYRPQTLDKMREFINR